MSSFDPTTAEAALFSSFADGETEALIEELLRRTWPESHYQETRRAGDLIQASGAQS